MVVLAISFELSQKCKKEEEHFIGSSSSGSNKYPNTDQNCTTGWGSCGPNKYPINAGKNCAVLDACLSLPPKPIPLPPAPSDTAYVLQNLVAYWDFTDSKSYPNSGNKLLDLSTNGNDLTLNNSPKINYTSDLSATFPRKSDATGKLNISSDINEISLEFLVKFSNIQNNNSWLINTCKDSPNEDFQTKDHFAALLSDGGFQIYMNGGHIYQNVKTFITTNKWYHVVYTCSKNKSECAIYVNGKSQSETISNGKLPTTDLIAYVQPTFPLKNINNKTIQLMDFKDNYSNSNDNSLSMCRIYNKVLSPDEVYRNYAAVCYKLTGNPFNLSPLPPPFTMQNGLASWNYNKMQYDLAQSSYLWNTNQILDEINRRNRIDAANELALSSGSYNWNNQLINNINGICNNGTGSGNSINPDTLKKLEDILKQNGTSPANASKNVDINILFKQLFEENTQSSTNDKANASGSYIWNQNLKNMQNILANQERAYKKHSRNSRRNLAIADKIQKDNDAIMNNQDMNINDKINVLIQGEDTLNRILTRIN
jgi:hypothetical protein